MAFALIGSGAFADVFDLGDGTVVKAYKRISHSGEVWDWQDHDALTVEMFAAEARAYETLRNIPDLAVYAPIFYGRSDPCSLVDPKQAEEYVAGCGLVLEMIAGKDTKVASPHFPSKAEIEPILERFANEVTSGNVWDSSCFIPGSRAQFTFIDFAVWEHLLECEEMLTDQGQFTAQQRQQLRERHNLCR